MMRFLTLTVLALIFLVSCKTQKQQTLTSPPVVLTDTDSVRVEKIIETVYVPVEVEVALPEESSVNATLNDSSHVETTIAFSDAWIADGKLFHTINNKEGKLKGTTYTPTTTERASKEVIREKEVPVPTPYPVEIERDFSTFERIKLSSFWYLVGALTIAGIYFLRKPILVLLRKVIKH